MAKKEWKQKLIPKKALLRASLIWETWVQCCYNYERMMGMACAHTFLPVVKYLYPDNKEKQIDLMTREMEFFNVHIEFGSCILGLAIALEEEKAMGVDIPNEFITNIKTSLMGPLAGVCDTIYQGVLIPILLALCIDITRSGDGNIWGAIVYTVLMVAISYIFSYINFMLTRARLQDLIRELWAQEEKKKTVFFVTHDVDEALLLANRILVLGQSPSHIIYDVTIPEEQHPTRDTLFENMEMMKLRMTLINQINKDVTTHI